MLGPLTASDAATTELRATLRSYLDSGESLIETAAARHVHRNTVAYRIRRIEVGLGHPVTERRTELYSALLLADSFTTLLDGPPGAPRPS